MGACVSINPLNCSAEDKARAQRHHAARFFSQRNQRHQRVPPLRPEGVQGAVLRRFVSCLQQTRFQLEHGHVRSDYRGKDTEHREDDVHHRPTPLLLAEELEVNHCREDKVHEGSRRRSGDRHHVAESRPEVRQHRHDQQRQHTRRHSREVGNKHARAVIRRLLQLLRLLHRHCNRLSRLLLRILLSSLRILRRLLGLRGVDDLVLQQGVVSVAAASYR